MKVIWIIDAEQWPRAMLRAELIERGFDAVGSITVRDAIAVLRRPVSLGEIAERVAAVSKGRV